MLTWHAYISSPTVLFNTHNSSWNIHQQVRLSSTSSHTVVDLLHYVHCHLSSASNNVRKTRLVSCHLRLVRVFQPSSCQKCHECSHNLWGICLTHFLLSSSMHLWHVLCQPWTLSEVYPRMKLIAWVVGKVFTKMVFWLPETTSLHSYHMNLYGVVSLRQAMSKRSGRFFTSRTSNGLSQHTHELSTSENMLQITQTMSSNSKGINTAI